MSSTSIPKSFQLGGVTFRVELREKLEDDNLGMCDYDNAVIYLASSAAPEVQEETFWHEVVEAVNAQHETRLAHPKIQTLSASIYQVLKTRQF